jgi:hypothetical protein
MTSIKGKMLSRDVLQHCLFVYDGQNRTFSLAF